MRHGCAPRWGVRSATRLDPPGARPPLVIGGSTIRSGQPSPWLRVRLDRRLQRARRSPGRPSRMAGWRACPQGPELDLPGMARGPLIQGRSWYGARRCGSTGKLKPFSVGVGRQREVLQDWALILIIDGDRGHLAGASSGLADLTWRTFRPTGQIRNMADVMRFACGGCTSSRPGTPFSDLPLAIVVMGLREVSPGVSMRSRPVNVFFYGLFMDVELLLSKGIRPAAGAPTRPNGLLAKRSSSTCPVGHALDEALPLRPRALVDADRRSHSAGCLELNGTAASCHAAR
jgi:hypothetical protein